MNFEEPDIVNELKLVESLDKEIDLFLQMKNNCFFIKSNNEIYLAFFDEKNNLKKLENTNINFNEKINSVSLSLDEKRIYICLKEKKSIRMLNCDLNNGIMEEDENEIND